MKKRKKSGKVKKIRNESMNFSGLMVVFFIGILSTLFLLLTGNQEQSSERKIFEIDFSEETISGEAKKLTFSNKTVEEKKVLCSCFFDSEKKYISIFIEVKDFKDCWEACSYRETPSYVEYIVN